MRQDRVGGSARFGVAASLTIFLVVWLSASPLFLVQAAFDLLYPANRYFPCVHYFAAFVVMLAASNVVGIASIWAGLGRAHWFLRSSGDCRDFAAVASGPRL